MGHMRRFRHKITGREDTYPDHFGDLPFLDLEPVDGSPCEDCVVDLDPKPVELDEKKDKKNGR